MTYHTFQILECSDPHCRMRFSSDLSNSPINKCPKCNSQMEIIGERYSNFQIKANEKPSLNLSLILDNLRSTSNVGSIFRTGDGAGVKHIYCCGITPTPDHVKIRKASLGAESYINWSWHPNSLLLARKLHDSGARIISIESNANSTSLFKSKEHFFSNSSLTLVLGNEISGVDPEILELSDMVLSIPMVGVKTSLNVAVAAGIAIFTIIHQNRE